MRLSVNNLSQKMQKRLDNWRNIPIPDQIQRMKNNPAFFTNQRFRRGDYGDDIRDYEWKDADQWQRDFTFRPFK